MLDNFLDDTLIILLGIALSFIFLGLATMLNNYLEDKYKKQSSKDTYFYYLINNNKNNNNKNSGGF